MRDFSEKGAGPGPSDPDTTHDTLLWMNKWMNQRTNESMKLLRVSEPLCLLRESNI